jgi:hypothetical protein
MTDGMKNDEFRVKKIKKRKKKKTHQKQKK